MTESIIDMNVKKSTVVKIDTNAKEYTYDDLLKIFSRITNACDKFVRVPKRKWRFMIENDLVKMITVDNEVDKKETATFRIGHNEHKFCSTKIQIHAIFDFDGFVKPLSTYRISYGKYTYYKLLEVAYFKNINKVIYTGPYKKWNDRGDVMLICYMYKNNYVGTVVDLEKDVVSFHEIKN